jgi:hypothetical protein
MRRRARRVSAAQVANAPKNADQIRAIIARHNQTDDIGETVRRISEERGHVVWSGERILEQLDQLNYPSRDLERATYQEVDGNPVWIISTEPGVPRTWGWHVLWNGTIWYLPENGGSSDARSLSRYLGEKMTADNPSAAAAAILDELIKLRADLWQFICELDSMLESRS